MADEVGAGVGPSRTSAASKRPVIVLHRNQACRECRKKKVKCDAAKPICTPCQKSAAVYGEPLTAESCTYPQPGTVAEALQPGKRKTVAALEYRIAELEKQLDEVENQNLRLKDFNSQPAVSPPSSLGYSPNYSSRPSPRSVHSSLSHSSSLSNIHATSGQDPRLTDPFLELIWSGWPADLPMPAVVGSLVSSFFASGLVITHMIDSVKLHQALLLPPTSPGFPHPALLHALCAVTAVFVPLESLGEPYWLPEASPSAYHANRAKVRADESIGKASGRHLLQICQALHLISLQSFSSAAFLDAWNHMGRVVRLLPPLGLNRLGDEHCPASRRSNTCAKPTLLDPPADEADIIERSVTFWQAFCCDRFMSACTGWAVAMDETDITTLLPGHPMMSGDELSARESFSGLDPHSYDFFSRHYPKHPLASLHMATKGAILLGRVSTLLQRGSSPMMGMQQTRQATQGADLVRYSSDFAKLDDDLRILRGSMARDFRIDAAKAGRADPSMIGAFLLPHAAIILLHEQFVTRDGDESMVKACEAARAISSVLHLCVSTGEVQYLSLAFPFVNFCWTVAGRTLVKDLAFGSLTQDVEREASARAEISLILDALAPFAALSQLGQMCEGMLRMLMEDPLATVPHTCR